MPFARALPPVPESENHVMMIETSRYLTNQLLYIGGKETVQYDNSRNGMNKSDAQASSAVHSERLHRV